MGVLLSCIGLLYLDMDVNPTSHLLTQAFLEFRISSESLEHFVDFLAYLEPKL